MAKGDRHTSTEENKNEEVRSKNESRDEEIKNNNEEKIKELQEKYLRALADYQNLDRQTQNWKEEFVTYANSDLIRQLLEVLDDLEKAQEHLKDAGLQLVIEKFKKILASAGVSELDLKGKEFDANLAEVVSTVPDEKANIVKEVLQKGYILKDRVIRPGKVIVTVGS